MNRLNGTKKWKCLFFATLAINLLIGITFSRSYWGYFFYPPMVMSEPSETLLSLGQFEVTPDERFFKPKEEIWGASFSGFALTKTYWQKKFKSKPWYIPGSILQRIPRDHKEKLMSSDLPPLDLSQEEQNNLLEAIEKSHVLVVGKDLYDHSHLWMWGVIAKFAPQDEPKKWLLGFRTQQVENDHIPYYEILFEQQRDGFKLLKSQMFYYDVAGIEFMEWPVIMILLFVLEWLIIAPILFVL